jgi:hypothetical protein
MNAQAKVEKAKEPQTLRIWNAVCKTDPKHTKRVNQRGGFTAIDAQYQIMEATRLFGPVGEGWGYTVGDYRIEGGMIVVPVTLWHGKRENMFGPILGCAEMLGQRPDRDAPKKAITDALTKGLSQLGFNADVFLGLFDDNKYVAEVTKEFAEDKGNGKREKLSGPYTSKTALWGAVKAFVHAVNGFSGNDELIPYLETEDVKALLEQCGRDAPGLLRDGLPDVPEYEPLELFIARKRREFEEIENIHETSGVKYVNAG